jgi:HK97 family phage major capsid protein
MNLLELRNEFTKLTKELESELKSDMNIEESREWDKKALKIEELKNKIDDLEKEENEKRKLQEENEKRKLQLENNRQKVNEFKSYEVNSEPEKRTFAEAKRPRRKTFDNLAEQLRAVKLFNTKGVYDERQERMEKELRASGMNTQIGEDGAFLIEPEFGGNIFETAVETGQLLSRIKTIPTNSNEIKFNSIKETDISSSVFGGVQVYWASEAGTVTKSSPEIKQESIKLDKLMGLAYATDELESDATFLSSLYQTAFATAVNRKIEESVIAGTGVGMPLGILNSDGLVEVAKESGQATNTIVMKNINNMWSRMSAQNRANSVWLINPDLEPKLEEMVFPVGTGGVPAYLGVGGLSETGYASLKGRPVIPIDLCPALSSKGDIILADLSDYMLLVKSSMQAKIEMSMHVLFLYAENTYRIVFRVGGKPFTNNALTIKNSSNSRGKYITLGAR